jgi:putative ABC transport system permease protein
VGFVFQSYNLIPHQTVLANVELALTISGIRRSERRRMAVQALEKVGLGSQIHKKPNQMSGGQMQRVAIARALVNNPDILLADEPTGALDTETSVQVMDLLKEVARDRLVVMVTHNPELAERYATRIVRLRDGRITDDSAPYTAADGLPAEHRTMGKASMSFGTSLALSFNNLRTKKARTLLTSFAGSIGIIGIALILALSTGVNDYISNIQKSTMTSYPITIESETTDLSGMMTGGPSQKKSTHGSDGVYATGQDLESASGVSVNTKKNNLAAFKKYLDNSKSKIRRYVGENGIIYSYDTAFSVYAHDGEGTLVNTDGSTLDETSDRTGTNGMQAMRSAMMGTAASSNGMQEMIPGAGKKTVSAAVTDNYKVLYGAWPKAYNEVVLVLDSNNEISTKTLYELGILPTSEYRTIMKKLDNGENVTLKQQKWSYEKLCAQTLYLLPASDTYRKNSSGTFTSVGTDAAQTETLLKKAVKLRISGVIRPKKDDGTASLSAPLAYTRLLTNYLIDHADKSAVVQAQQQSPKINVLNGMTFEPESDAVKIADAKRYLSRLGVSDKAAMFRSIAQSQYAAQPQKLAMLMQADENTLASMLDGYLKHPSDAVLLSIYKTSITPGSYDDNLKTFGAVDRANPSSVSIYADSFDDKSAIADCIKAYNKSASDADQITYTDYVALLTGSVEKIVNVISYVLIAFVALSLVVSSIMIGIITYISVLERTKEIGILRAMGASKRNISQVFNAETFLIGLCSGAIGIGVSLLLMIPGNALIRSLTKTADVRAVLPARDALILVALSVGLTLLGGLIPAKKAAKKDPVVALRTE